MNELVDFVYSNYPTIHSKVTWEQTAKLFELYKDKVIVIKEKNMDKETIKGVGLYLRLPNKIFNEVKDKILDLTIPQNTAFCLNQNGKNIHFILLVANKVKTILKGLKEVIKRENPKTISWFSPDMNDFFIRRF